MKSRIAVVGQQIVPPTTARPLLARIVERQRNLANFMKSSRRIDEPLDARAGGGIAQSQDCIRHDAAACRGREQAAGRGREARAPLLLPQHRLAIADRLEAQEAHASLALPRATFT